MFYDQATITFLTDRVGWADALDSVSMPISADNMVATSLRHFNRFNALVTVENVNACVPYASIQNTPFNDYLLNLKQENVLSILTVVFDNEERANYTYCYRGNRIDISSIDYSATIQSKSRLFDNLIGLKMAITCLELFLTTDRQNATERSNKFSYGQLKQELEGVMSQDGSQIMTKGLYTKFSIELEKVKNILFPVQKKNTVRGVSVW